MTTSFLSVRFALLATALALLADARAGLVQSWQFDEPADTALPATLNSVPGGAVFAEALPGVTTNGAGSLVIASNLLSGGRAFAQIGEISTGILQLDVHVAGWNFAGITAEPGTGPLAEFGLSSEAVQGNDIRTAHLFIEADNTAGLTLSGVARSAGGDGVSTASSTPLEQDQVFGPVRTTPLTIRLVLNFSTLDYTVSTSDTAFAVQAAGKLASGKPARYVTLRALDDFTIGGTGGHFTIDSITLTHTPPPPPPLTPPAWRELHFPAPADATLATDAADPDGDGLPNLLEYATGTVPTAADPSPTSPGRNASGHLTLGFASVADAGLTYEVFASSDLAEWTRIFSATGAELGAGPQLIPDTQPATATPRRFLRLVVGPTPAALP